MAVVPRKRKSGKVVYYVTVHWHGKQLWEPAGSSKRQAEQLDRELKKDVAAGTYQPRAGTKALTLWQWFESWMDTRRVRSAKDEERWIRLHVLPRHWLSKMAIDEVRPRHTDQLVRELQAEGKLADKSIGNVLGVLSVMFKAAHRAEVVSQNPVSLDRKTLRRAPAQEREPYTPAEVRVLTRHATINWPIRVLNALCLLGGLREGEACGRRWRDLYADSVPLWALHVRDQYDGAPLKTERPRMVPVHPELAEALEAWGREGFELYTGHKPRPEDFIVPNAGKRSKVRHHTRSSYYKAFVRSCALVGIQARTLHATRHTFITLARRGGAPKDVLEKVTHNARGDIVDRYTHYAWEPLCEAVLKLDLDAHQGPQLPPGSSGKTGQGPQWLGRRTVAELPATAESAQSSIPGASTIFQQENRGPRKSRQGSRQGPELPNEGKPYLDTTGDEADFQAALAESGERAEAHKVVGR